MGRVIDQVRAHLAHRQAAPEGVAQLDEVHQDDVIDQGTHVEHAHHRRHAEHLRILQVVHGRDLVLLHQRDHRMEKIAEQASLGTQGQAVSGEAVDEHAPGFELLHHLFDPVKMVIDVDFLRRVVLHHDDAAIERLLQIDADARCVAQ